jgi:hypothetical protein
MPAPCRVPVSTLLAMKAEPIDWSTKINELLAADLTLAAIATACNVSPEAVGAWKKRGITPRHHDGETVLALHKRFCQKKPDTFDATIGADGEIRYR